MAVRKNFKLLKYEHIICHVKGQLQRFYKLMSYERAFKMLKNDMCITEIGQAVSSYKALKMGRGILIEVGKCRFPTFRTPHYFRK